MIFNYIICDLYDDKMLKLILEELFRHKFKSEFYNLDILLNFYNFQDIEDCCNYLIYGNLHEKENYINYKNLNNFINSMENNDKIKEVILTIYSIKKFKTFMRGKIKTFVNYYDNNGGICTDKFIKDFKLFAKNNKIVDKKIKPVIIYNDKYKNDLNEGSNYVYSLEIVKNIFNNTDFYGLFLQSLIQRVNKKRKLAIKNKKYLCPFKNSELILLNTCSFVANNYLKKFNLISEIDYINFINTEKSNRIILKILQVLKLKKFVRLQVLKKINLISEEKLKLVKSTLDNI